MRWVLAVIATLALAGCGAPRPNDGRLHIVAAFYPLQYVAERVGGDRVSVTNLVAPGAEPHDLELSPRQTASIADADLVTYLHGFQASVDEAVRQEAPRTAFDAAFVGDGRDPHVWLDPTRLATIAGGVADRLAAIDPAGGDGYRQRAAALRTDLANLDATYAQALHSCQRHEIVTSHAAFGYLAQRYHLTQVAITGLQPDSEPTPRHLADAAEQAKAHGATTIFFETLVSPKVAETVARASGARAVVLDPIEGLEPGSTGDYVSVMRENLTTLVTALGCA
jgi:zinc transport system substrate-binding protein